jgi:AraC family transcriptional regulator
MIQASPAGVGGNVTRRLELKAFTLSHAVYVPQRTPRHSHNHSLLSFTLAGRFRATIEDEAWECATRTLRVLPAGATHDEFYDQRTSSLLVEIDGRAFRDAPAVARALQTPIQFAPLTEPSHIGLRIYNELREDRNHAGLMVEGLLLELLATVSRADTAATVRLPPGIRRAKEFLNDTFRQHLSMADVARVAGMHPTSLSRAFRRHLRTTPGDYQRALRVEWARQRLLGSTDALGRIAAEAGFSDHAHFSRVFRSIHAMSPSQYRYAHSAVTWPGSRILSPAALTF